MTPKEQEIAIGELEERVDRLRNIYEQYFLGFEKLEPTVPRKDVDRRLQILRKEQIRNTAMRFRFQVVTQKYNTYAMHWVRICRQIEDGTYKRHIRKAKARFGDVARAPERDVSIDIDLGDFEEVDVNDVLAEADAATAAHTRDASDAVPAPAQAAARPERAGRGAALPPGARPMLVRRRDEAEPPPARTSPGAPPSSQAGPAQPGPAASAPSQRALHGAVQGAPHSAPKLRPMNPASTVRRPVPSSPDLERGSTGHQAAATPSAGAPGAARIPVAAPSAGTSVPRVAAAPVTGPSGRLPLPPPSSRDMPAGRPAPSAGRLPAPSTGRLPAPPPSPSAGRLPAPPPPPSAGRLPAPPPMKLPPTSMPRPVPAAPRAPMPSVSDAAASEPRARAPVPLPSQSTRPPKNED